MGLIIRIKTFKWKTDVIIGEVGRWGIKSSETKKVYEQKSQNVQETFTFFMCFVFFLSTLCDIFENKINFHFNKSTIMTKHCNAWSLLCIERQQNDAFLIVCFLNESQIEQHI